jgi:hypothetical protein
MPEMGCANKRSSRLTGDSPDRPPLVSCVALKLVDHARPRIGQPARSVGRHRRAGSRAFWDMLKETHGGNLRLTKASGGERSPQTTCVL